MMNSSEIQRVQASFALVRPIADVAADLFYLKLFRLAPEVRDMFPDDLAEQKKKLVAVLGVAVGGLSRPETLLPVLRDLGSRHAGYGVADVHYDVVGQALIETLAEGLGASFDDETRAAWIACYGLVSGEMKRASRIAA